MESSKVVPAVYGRIRGFRPCARDGHASVVVGRKMIIIGGDRHKMPFNDIFECDLDLALAKI